MSNKPEVERAAEVMRKVAITDFAGYAAAISAAGLLRTESDRLNARSTELLLAMRRDTFCANPDLYSSQVETAMRHADAILDARKPKVAPLDEVLTLWRECKCKVPGPLSDALDRLAAERAK